MEVLAILTIVASIAVGWSIGANDAANSIGTAVGSKAIKLVWGIVLVCLFGFLGAYFQGQYVTKTIGKGIVAMNKLDKNIAMQLAVCASFAACIWVALATWWKMPISTSHSIVGAMAGGGLAIGTPVAWKVLGNIFICWLVTPVGAAIMGFVIYWILKNTLKRFMPELIIERSMKVLVVLSGCYMAFTWGANDVANATGVASGASVLTPKMAVIIGGAAILLGIITMGYKVIETVGSGMVTLVPLMAFAVQLASSLNVQLYTLLGVPVSTSHSIVGAVFGVGLVSGVKTMNFNIMKDIITCWIATPFVSGIVCFALLKIIPLF